MGPRPKHLGASQMRHILSSQPCCGHVASPEASSLPDLLKFRIRGNVKCFTEQSLRTLATNADSWAQSGEHIESE